MRARLKQEWFDGVRTVGVTSGASVPEELVDEVLSLLAGAGYGDVEEVKTAEEDLIFSLPKELRRDLNGNADARGVGGRIRTTASGRAAEAAAASAAAGEQQ